MEKCFNFKVEVVSKLNGYVYAKSIEEAIRLIYDGKWEEIEEGNIQKVSSIKSIEEDLNYGLYNDRI